MSVRVGLKLEARKSYGAEEGGGGGKHHASQLTPSTFLASFVSTSSLHHLHILVRVLLPSSTHLLYCRYHIISCSVFPEPTLHNRHHRGAYEMSYCPSSERVLRRATADVQGQNCIFEMQKKFSAWPSKNVQQSRPPFQTSTATKFGYCTERWPFSDVKSGQQDRFIDTCLPWLDHASHRRLHR